MDFISGLVVGVLVLRCYGKGEPQKIPGLFPITVACPSVRPKSHQWKSAKVVNNVGIIPPEKGV